MTSTPKRQKRSHTVLTTNDDKPIEIDDQDLEALEAIFAGYSNTGGGNIPSHDRQEIIKAIRKMNAYPKIDLRDRRIMKCGVTFMAHPAIGRLDALTALTIGSLRGELPPEIGQLSNLELLSIDAKDLCGLMVIPPEFGNLRKLKYFSMECCLIVSLRFDEFGKLINLKSLYLDKCYALIHIPTSIGQLESLENLSLPASFVSVEFPKEIGRLSALKKLHVGDNLIREQFLSLEAFKTKQVADSGASSAFPEIANLVSLEGVVTKLRPFLFFPASFFANSRKLSSLTLLCDVNDTSSIDISYFSNVPPSLQRLYIEHFKPVFESYQEEENLDGRQIGQTEDDEDDVLLQFPRVGFPYQLLVRQRDLRRLVIEGTGSAGYPISFSMMQNLQKLETMTLHTCNFVSALPTTSVIYLPLLRDLELVNVKGTINFERLNMPSLEQFSLLHYRDHGRKITVRVSGPLPALKKFSITSDIRLTPKRSPADPGTLPNNKLSIFEYDGTAQLPKLHELLLQQCFVIGNAAISAPNEALNMPQLKILRLRNCYDFDLSKWETPHLNHVEFINNQKHRIPGWQQLNMLSTDLLSRCPKLTYLNISRLKCVQNIPKATVSSLPQSIRRLRLSCSQLVDIATDEKNAVELLGRCQQLGCFGEDYLSEEVVQAVSTSAACQKIGHLLSLNRARSRLIIDAGPVKAALFPLIFKHAPRVFESNDGCDEDHNSPKIRAWFVVQTHPDAIFQLLRELLLPEIFH